MKCLEMEQPSSHEKVLSQMREYVIRISRNAGWDYYVHHNPVRLTERFDLFQPVPQDLKADLDPEISRGRLLCIIVFAGYVVPSKCRITYVPLHVSQRVKNLERGKNN